MFICWHQNKEADLLCHFLNIVYLLLDAVEEKEISTFIDFDGRLRGIYRRLISEEMKIN